MKIRETVHYSYVLEDLLSSKNSDVEGNQFQDPLFADPKKDDYSLRAESPAARMGKGGGAIGASADVAQEALKKLEAQTK